jgi:hypothetical protein
MHSSEEIANIFKILDLDTLEKRRQHLFNFGIPTPGEKQNKQYLVMTTDNSKPLEYSEGRDAGLERNTQ